MEIKNLYSDEELKLFKIIENQGLWPMEKKIIEEQKKNWQRVAENTVKKRMKKKHFNIRLFESDIDKIKAQALREGLPYQTYLASMVHKIALSSEYQNSLDEKMESELLTV